jgi:hypothetical protein
MPADGSRAQLTAADLDALRRRGLDPTEVERQLALLADPPPPVELIAPAAIANGIEAIGEAERPALLELWRDAAEGGRLSKLVPASGAASRMFASLSRALEGGSDLTVEAVRAGAAQGDATAKDVLTFASRLRDFPFRAALASAVGGAFASIEALQPGADLRPALASLLRPEGLGFAGLAKGLVPFHRRDDRPVTPVEEHVDEALLLVRDGHGISRVHFTIPEGAEAAFESVAGNPEGAEGRIELQLSSQSPASDTVALAADGKPFRTSDGALLFRPGGHGALLRNLEQMNGDLVLVKNIDNVQPADRRATSILWQRLLVGLLVRLQRETWALLDRLDDDRDAGAVGDARAFVARWLGPSGAAPAAAGAEDRAALRARLDRPLRVAGMVVNAGEPGGGPFWTRDRAGGVSKQIVETAEIAPSEPQQEILRASTHFNPVLLALALRDRRGRPYRLADFVDASRVFVSERTSGGATLRALEHPGLWNGSMAGWNTVFVEIPKEAFTPVKTLLDLLRPEHQPAT